MAAPLVLGFHQCARVIDEPVVEPEAKNPVPNWSTETRFRTTPLPGSLVTQLIFTGTVWTPSVVFAISAWLGALVTVGETRSSTSRPPVAVQKPPSSATSSATQTAVVPDGSWATPTKSPQRVPT